MSFKIFTDSGASLSKEQAEKHDITIMSMGYVINGEEFVGQDETEEFIKTVYKKMKEKETVSTNAVNSADLSDAFEKVLGSGEDILYIAFASTLSSSFENASNTAEEVNKKYKERKVVVIDSCCAAMGQGMIVIEAAKQKASGKTIDAVAKWVDENKMKAVHLFTVDNLAYLYRGGRLKKSTAIIGSMLHIKPLMHFDTLCKLTPYGKALGRNLALKAIANMVQKKIVNPEEQTIYISHAESINDALTLQKAISEKITVEDFEINDMGLVIGAHAGPGTLAVFFFGNR
ncbi:MAG: DegV family protein [Christensenellaceae bacterium]|jgi:DegV family protein with EDD domain|nr:DegV family protein [Christensenellaceae bacterium]